MASIALTTVVQHAVLFLYIQVAVTTLLAGAHVQKILEMHQPIQNIMDTTVYTAACVLIPTIMVIILGLQSLMQTLVRCILTPPVVIAKISPAAVAVVDVTVKTGISTQDTVERERTSWPARTHIRAILDEAEWCRSHGFN
jgi:hypothetical protein